MHGHGASAKAPGEYCFKWSDYPADVANIFLEVLRAQCMVDVTVCAEGRRLHAHRIVLSACSAYLQEILSCTDDAHPVLILSGISFDDVQSVIEFMYQGEISVGADRIKSVLNTAEELQIRGLMGVSSHFEEKGESEEEGVMLPKESPPEQVEASTEAEVADRDLGTSEVIEPRSSDEMGQDEDEAKGTVNLTKYDDKKRRCRRKSCRKDYSEESLAAALEELRAGRSLVSTAGEHGIPRSTLYVRARSQGIQLAVCRQGHRGDRVQAAIKAVTDGASLQKAAEQYQIPKTVLWRNVRKQLGARPPAGRAGFRRKTYDEEKRRAAVRALEQGDNLTRVSHQYQIPKTTLFREKTRLVETGRLPWSCLKRRGPYLDGFKRSRLGEAVAACKDGRMSQAAASVTFQVPKTTIWRRLQERGAGSCSPGRRGGTLKVEAVDEDEPAAVQQFAFSQVGSHIPVTYVQESEFGEASLIILAPGDADPAEESGRVVVEPPSETEETEEPETVDSENIEIIGSDNITDENESMANEDVT